MESDITDLCCGCLSSDRKMKLISEICNDKYLLQLFCDIQVLQKFMKNPSHSICWECERHILNFVAFTKRVKSCYKLLQNNVKGNSKLETLSSLKTFSMVTGSTSPTNLTDNYANIISVKISYINKEESNVDIKDNESIKEEIDYYASDDNKSLLEELPIYHAKEEKRRKVKKKSLKRIKSQEPKTFEEIYLTPEQIAEERSTMSQKDEYVNAMYKCERCIIPFPNEDDLKDHIVVKHELHATKFVCDVCACSFGAMSSLTYHVTRHSRRRRCTACSYISGGARQCSLHYRRVHCAGDTFDMTTKLYQNGGQKRTSATRGLISEDQYPCEFCQKTFRWKTSLRKHMETHKIESGQKRKPYCETCRQSFTTTSSLQKHMRKSSKHQIQLKVRQLSNPNKDPDETAKYIEDIKSNVNSKVEKYPCNQCGKKFQWKGNLWRHMQSHVARANGSLVCSPCNRTFSSLATYKQHMKISKKHVSENDFKFMCSDCGKKFSNKTKLKDHIDWDHLKIFTHICADCQKPFKSHTSLYLHRQVSHKRVDSEHLCHHCGKAYPNKTRLLKHISAIHMKESPYKCDLCSAKFNWGSSLSRHLKRVHKTVRKVLL